MANMSDQVLLEEFEKRRSQLAGKLLIGKRSKRWGMDAYPLTKGRRKVECRLKI